MTAPEPWTRPLPAPWAEPQADVRGDNADEVIRLRDALTDAEYQSARWVADAAKWERRAYALRDLLDEIGVMAANAPEGGDSFAVLEEIAMRVAAADVPDSTPLLEGK